jgi:hypothetical protein
VRAAKLCTSGARIWLTRYGVSWTKFLDEGVSADFLRETGDPLALRVVREVERELIDVNRK